jgi:glycerol uptake facilitator-like aquaporin
VSGPNATAGLFATYPQPYLTVRGGIVDQLIGTAVL